MTWPSAISPTSSYSSRAGSLHAGDHEALIAAVNSLITMSGVPSTAFASSTWANTGTASNGQPEGAIATGMVSPVSGVDVQAVYTQTGDPNANFVGGVRVNWSPTLNYAGEALVGPRVGKGFFGPRAAFQLEGVADYKFSTTSLGLAPLSFQDQMVVKNELSTAANFSPAWQFLASRLYIAEGATVNAKHTDISRGAACFMDNNSFATTNSGVLNLTDGSPYTYTSFLSDIGLVGNVTLARRVGFEVADVDTGSSHATAISTILNAGPFSGKVQGTFDATTSTLTEQIGVLIGRLTGAATTNTGIQCDSPIKLWQDTATLTATPALAPFAMAGTFTLDFASANFGTALIVQPTVVLKQAGSAFNAYTAVTLGGTVKNDSSLSGTVVSANVLFNANTTYQADTGSVTYTTVRQVQAAAITSRVNSGTLTVSTLSEFYAQGSIGTGTTVTTHKAFDVANPGGAGTITTQIGLDVASLTRGSTNIGIRNASTRVETPTAQTISSAATAVNHTAARMALTNSSGGSLTLTAAPTVTDGQTGETLTLVNVGSQNIVLQDQATLASSNLRLLSSRVTLRPRDQLMLDYDSTVGDWVQRSLHRRPPLAVILNRDMFG